MEKIIMEKQRKLLESQDDQRNKIYNERKIQQKKIIERGGDLIVNRVDVEREKINLAGEEFAKQKENK